MSKRGYREGKWSPEDDNSLRELMNIPAYSHQWKLISESIQRSPKSCQQRWKRRLDPTLNKSSWTPEEDRMIVENVEKFGRDWHAVVKEMPGRDHATVAERYDNYLAPYLKKGKWSFDESKLMLEGLIKYGRSWADIHQLIPWRSRIYIRNFYDRAIQPGLAKLDPSLSEKERLQILLKNPEYIRCLIRT
ncbi:Myb- protein A [Basidiobolus ranarum]|uniref:Myb- protein A n=1 Tax=Basidiobolus ranarum TaxID=34480 RepID=A0ABR2WIS9_9FUNG